MLDAEFLELEVVVAERANEDRNDIRETGKLQHLHTIRISAARATVNKVGGVLPSWLWLQMPVISRRSRRALMAPRAHASCARIAQRCSQRGPQALPEPAVNIVEMLAGSSMVTVAFGMDLGLDFGDLLVHELTLHVAHVHHPVVLVAERVDRFQYGLGIAWCRVVLHESQALLPTAVARKDQQTSTLPPPAVTGSTPNLHEFKLAGRRGARLGRNNTRRHRIASVQGNCRVWGWILVNALEGAVCVDQNAASNHHSETIAPPHSAARQYSG